MNKYTFSEEEKKEYFKECKAEYYEMAMGWQGYTLQISYPAERIIGGETNKYGMEYAEHIGDYRYEIEYLFSEQPYKISLDTESMEFVATHNIAKREQPLWEGLRIFVADEFVAFMEEEDFEEFLSW